MKDWKEEFNQYWFVSKDRTKNSTNAHRYEVKAFIQALLDQQKQDLIKKLREEKKNIEHRGCVRKYEHCECHDWEKENQALDRAIEIIRGER